MSVKTKYRTELVAEDCCSAFTWWWIWGRLFQIDLLFMLNKTAITKWYLPTINCKLFQWIWGKKWNYHKKAPRRFVVSNSSRINGCVSQIESLRTWTFLRMNEEGENEWWMSLPLSRLKTHQEDILCLGWDVQNLGLIGYMEWTVNPA